MSDLLIAIGSRAGNPFSAFHHFIPTTHPNQAAALLILNDAILQAMYSRESLVVNLFKICLAHCPALPGLFICTEALAEQQDATAWLAFGTEIVKLTSLVYLALVPDSFPLPLIIYSACSAIQGLAN